MSKSSRERKKHKKRDEHSEPVDASNAESTASSGTSTATDAPPKLKLVDEQSAGQSDGEQASEQASEQTPAEGGSSTATAESAATESGPADAVTLQGHTAAKGRVFVGKDEAFTTIFKFRDSIRQLQAREDAAHENWKYAKKRREDEELRLMEYIDEIREPSLFNLPKSDAETTPAKCEPGNEPWRSVTTQALGIPEKTCELLADHSPRLLTLGHIADFTTAGGQLTDIKGVGEGKAAKIEDCFNRFWETYTGPVEGTPKEESGGAESGAESATESATESSTAETDAPANEESDEPVLAGAESGG